MASPPAWSEAEAARLRALAQPEEQMSWIDKDPGLRAELRDAGRIGNTRFEGPPEPVEAEYVQIVYTLNSEEEVRSPGMFRWEAEHRLWALAVLDKQPIPGKRVAKAIIVPVTVGSPETTEQTFREGQYH